jgi:hypothetical protein
VGFTEEQNVQIEYRWAGGHYDRLPALADELVKQGAAFFHSSPLFVLLTGNGSFQFRGGRLFWLPLGW